MIWFWVYSLSWISSYGVALGSRIEKFIGLFCKRALLKRRNSTKRTCNCIDPTNRSSLASPCVMRVVRRLLTVATP